MSTKRRTLLELLTHLQSVLNDLISRDDDLSATDDLESRSSNLDSDPSVCRPQLSELEFLCNQNPETQGGKEEVKSTLNCSRKDALTYIVNNISDHNLGAAAAYRSNNYGAGGVNIGDQCPHTCCRQRKSQNQSFEMALEATLLLSSVHAAGAYTFGQMIRSREHDPNSKRSLEAFIALFAASFSCTFFGALMLLIIVSCRKYYQHKKLCLVISNTASIVLMMIGYCFVVAFNM